MNKRYCLTLDLKDDDELIRKYEEHHRAIWPEILQSIKAAGVVQMEIYRTANRLCMIMEVDESFSFERKQQLDQDNEKVQQWEELMWKYQQALPWAKPGEKWIFMDKIFQLTDY
jgi:L-rhamnose mutarotase